MIRNALAAESYAKMFAILVRDQAQCEGQDHGNKSSTLVLVFGLKPFRSNQNIAGLWDVG